MTLIGVALVAATAGKCNATADPGTLSLVAKADLAAGEGAVAQVRVNGTQVASLTVSSTTYSTYTLPLPSKLKAGDKVDVFFSNDAYQSGEDRNLYLQSATSAGVVLSPVAATSVYDIGTNWQEATDGQRVIAGATKLAWAGALRMVAAAGAASAAPSAQSALSHPFNSSSFWYQPIPADAPINPLSATYVNDLLGDLSTHGTATLNTQSYSPPIYRVDSSTPRQTIRYDNCTGSQSDPQWLATNWSNQFAQVPIPAGAKASSGQDKEVVIWSPATHEVWELWQFQSTASGYTACWGGKIADTSTSDGVFQHPFGVAASGLSMLGGTVRADEVAAGSINHAIEIGVNRPRSGTFSWPANRTDGTWDSAEAIPEGLRLRLNPNLDLSSLNLDPIGRMIAIAAQKYGFIVRDNSTGPVVVYGENAEPYVTATGVSPYAQVSTQPYYKWLVGFPWDKLQALPMDYGKP